MGPERFFACYILSHFVSSRRQQLVRHPANDGSCTRERVLHSRQRCIGTNSGGSDMLARLELMRSPPVASSFHEYRMILNVEVLIFEKKSKPLTRSRRWASAIELQARAARGCGPVLAHAWLTPPAELIKTMIH